MTNEALTPCPKCGHMTENLVFCDACGAVLAEQSAPPPRPEPQGPNSAPHPVAAGQDEPAPNPFAAEIVDEKSSSKSHFKGSPLSWFLILAAAVGCAGVAAYFLFIAKNPPPSAEELIRRNEALLVPLERLLGAPVPEMAKQQGVLAHDLQLRKQELSAAAQSKPDEDAAARIAMLQDYRNRVEALAGTRPEALHTSATELGSDALLLPLRKALAQAKVGRQKEPAPGGATVELPRATPASTTSAIASVPILDAARRQTESFARRAALAKGEIVQLDEESFDEEVKPSADLWVVIFAAPWSAAAKDLTPALQEMARDYAGKVKFGRVDTDAEKILAARYSVSGMLTILVTRNGEFVNRFREPRTGSEIRRRLAELVGR